jgi:hypothetical protein
MYVPNTPAPERALGDRTGDNYLGGSNPDGVRVAGLQPKTDANPDGELVGIPLMSIR